MSDVLEFRLVLRDVSPLIWRRVHVRPTMTLAEVHEVILVLMEWSDDFLHRFLLHGRTYRVWRPHAPEGQDARSVTLADLQLCAGEVVRYEYNLLVPWTVNLRLKTVLPERRGRTYPYLVAGQRAAPPEDLRGVGEYLERRHWHELHPPFHALKDLATAVQRRLAGEADTDNSALDEALERVSMYVQYTSTQLNISKLRQALLALPQEAQE
ncbi:plasmid pRiA4b ORF-3 family protein [Deinococcus sp. SM5_A1]|uniref:plasmid pRiA4b ORF-3 family protein n=1 Tax=Deinococcus sp. SM5_A1 TaxID=3379094 RepID=UPI00385903D6